MSVDEREIVGAHRAALAGLQALAREWTIDELPAELPSRLVRVVAAESPAPQALEFARTYVFAARVGGASADHERAKQWLEGWMAAPRRTATEAQAAIVDGIRFAQRLHRALGIDERSAGR